MYRRTSTSASAYAQHNPHIRKIDTGRECNRHTPAPIHRHRSGRWRIKLVSPRSGDAVLSSLWGGSGSHTRQPCEAARPRLGHRIAARRPLHALFRFCCAKRFNCSLGPFVHAGLEPSRRRSCGCCAAVGLSPSAHRQGPHDLSVSRAGGRRDHLVTP